MSNIMKLTQRNFDETIETHSLIFIDFWAHWCAPCRSFGDIYHAVAREHPDILFAQVNVEEEPSLASDFNVRSIPTLLVINKKIAVFCESGAMPRIALEDLVKQARALP